MALSKAIRWCVVCVVLGNIAWGQSAEQFAYRITFKDKQGSTGSVSNPATYLSARSLHRRTVQGIAVDTTDLPVSIAYIDSVSTITGGILHVTSRWLNDAVFLLSDSAAISQLRHKPYITNIAFIAYYPTGLHKRIARSNKFAKEQVRTIASSSYATTGSASYYGQTYPQTAMVNGDYLHDAGYKGQGMLIAVLDAGFIAVDTHAGFDSLRSSGRLLDVHNFVMHNEDVYSYDTHGMEVLSTQAGYLPGLYVGTAPLADYALYITEDNNSEQPVEMDNMLAATERADSLGADVISVSLGYNTFDDIALFGLTYADLDGINTIADKAANMATAKGILYVPTAGNEGGNSWNHILTPGDADSALTIGAVNSSRFIVGFSGQGPNAAGQIKPDVCDLGEDANIFLAGTGDRLGVGSGTSFSTPQIAGWAACLWQDNKAATPYMVRQAIIKSADRYTTPDNSYGYGIPDFSKAIAFLSVNDTTTSDTINSWISITPNPFTSIIHIRLKLPAIQMVYFILTDASGKRILEYSQLTDTWSQPELDLTVPSHLPSGIYFLKAETPSLKQVVRLVHL